MRGESRVNQKELRITNQTGKTTKINNNGNLFLREVVLEKLNPGALKN